MRTKRSTLLSLAAFAVLGAGLAELAYPQQASFCSKTAQCKDYTASCTVGIQKGTCSTDSKMSAVGCVRGSEACASTDVGTTCPGTCSVNSSGCNIIVYVCAPAK